MKKGKLFCVSLLAICMIMCNWSVITVIAQIPISDDVSISSDVLPIEGELQPMVANECDGNKYHHIFDNQEHNLDPFLDHYGGDQAAAYGAVLTAGQSYVAEFGIAGVQQFVVLVDGFQITVCGNVIGGRLRIGTFYIA